jgi:hypothetical protein
MLAKAQRAFAGFRDVSWLVWGAVLMPVMAKEAEEERKLAEAKRLAELAAKEVEERKIAKLGKVEALLERHSAGEIDDEGLEAGLQALDEEYGPDEMPAVLSDEEEEADAVENASEPPLTASTLCVVSTLPLAVLANRFS